MTHEECVQFMKTCDDIKATLQIMQHRAETLQMIYLGLTALALGWLTFLLIRGPK